MRVKNSGIYGDDICRIEQSYIVSVITNQVRKYIAIFDR